MTRVITTSVYTGAAPREGREKREKEREKEREMYRYESLSRANVTDTIIPCHNERTLAMESWQPKDRATERLASSNNAYE